jgi:hypothetical protein
MGAYTGYSNAAADGTAGVASSANMPALMAARDAYADNGGGGGGDGVVDGGRVSRPRLQQQRANLLENRRVPTKIAVFR